MIYFRSLHRENAMRKMFAHLWIKVNGKYRFFYFKILSRDVYKIFMKTYIFMSIHKAMKFIDTEVSIDL